MQTAAEQEKIAWSFNPPSAPHFGGLWKSGVKAIKTHLKRVIGDQILTIEEFNTLLAQVEAVLNSRPLCPLSSDPNDLGVLSPGHFLTLEPLVSVPHVDLELVPINRLSRWQMVQHQYGICTNLFGNAGMRSIYTVCSSVQNGLIPLSRYKKGHSSC
ncbi:hypothetical protein RF55_8527 [Lasius niger]|uniref:Integrase catalytic domain-containing protein n=1 Tax=Lasius niger TaxID=67767 RepID=A0A0J7KMR7_LASNI|nr:hypothetical protein RF55_8527 [Lasius niger]